jgi:hypothetical protein
MTSDVTFSETGFAFTHDGTHYEVHTAVGEGPARVMVEEVVPEPIDMEGEEE